MYTLHVLDLLDDLHDQFRKDAERFQLTYGELK